VRAWAQGCRFVFLAGSRLSPRLAQPCDLGAARPRLVPLGDGEHEQRDAAAKERSGDDVGEPVHLEVRATPGHADNSEARERPPPSAAHARCGEEQDERQAGRAGVGGMAGGEGGSAAGASTAKAKAARASQRRRRRRSSPTSVSPRARPSPRPSQLNASARSVRSGVSR